MLSGTWWWDVSRALDAPVPVARPPRAPSAPSPGGAEFCRSTNRSLSMFYLEHPSAKMVDSKAADADPGHFFSLLPYSYSNLTYTPGRDHPLCFCPLLCWTPRVRLHLLRSLRVPPVMMLCPFSLLPALPGMMGPLPPRVGAGDTEFCRNSLPRKPRSPLLPAPSVLASPIPTSGSPIPLETSLQVHYLLQPLRLLWHPPPLQPSQR